VKIVLSFKMPVRKTLLLVVVLLFASFALSVGSTEAQSSPEDVAKGLIAAEDANNVDAAVAYFADDAVVTLADGSKYDTADGVRGWQQSLADGHFRLEPVDMQVDGNTVSWTGTISLDAFRSLGIADLGGNWKLDIEDGKIKTFDFTFTPSALTELTAGSVVATLVGAEGGHDIDIAVAQFADDAVVNLADGSKYDTLDGIRGWQQALADGKFHLEPVARLVEGNTVTMYGTIGLDLFRSLGIASLGSVWKITVVDGKVKTFDFTFTPDALSALQAAMAAAASATPEATPGS
jgi:hypothetical protein